MKISKVMTVLALSMTLAIPSATHAAQNSRQRGVVAQHKFRSGCSQISVRVINNANVSASALQAVERTAQIQSEQVSRAWNGTPCIYFSNYGSWIVTLNTGCVTHSDGSVSCNVGGDHCGSASPNSCRTSIPTAHVLTGRTSYTNWVRTWTHELLETEVNPTANPNYPEPADPVNNLTYTVNGLRASDFVFPGWYFRWPGPWDQAGVLTGPMP